MKTLKCKSCGAKLKIDKNQEYANCEYCGTSYKLKEDVDPNNINVNFDFNNEAIQFGAKFIGIYKIIFIVIASIIMCTVLFNVLWSLNWDKGTNQTSVNEITNAINQVNKNEIINTISQENKIDEFKVKQFNSTFQSYSGTQSQFFVDHLLDLVITNNKTNANQTIKVIYRGTNTTNEDDIINIKHSLEQNKKYEVRIDYDADGFVNKVTIEDI